MPQVVSNMCISNNITLIHNKLLYLSLLKLYGINRYSTNVILSLHSFSVYKNYTDIKYMYYIYLINIFKYITFNINNFKKKSNLYNKRKYNKIF